MRNSRSILLPLLISLLLSYSCSNGGSSPDGPVDGPAKLEYALVLHGGAGYMNFENLPEDRQLVYNQALDSALNIGLELLDGGKTSIEAVEAVIRFMEDNPLFNAGRGAVFTADGTNELDASIMSGLDRNAGAVAGVKDIRHPISAARAVMENSPHVMLSGSGASRFAGEQGLELVDPAFFYNADRFKSYQRAKENEKHGTVGCVALDRDGNLAAGTSTGGMTNKKWGRIGDSPVIGAGTWASNSSCGVSATGHGEYFIRWAVAHDIAALMEYRGMSVEAAANEVVMQKLVKAGGDGGVICLDSNGYPAMVSNTSGMFRAYGNSAGEHIVAIFME